MHIPIRLPPMSKKNARQLFVASAKAWKPDTKEKDEDKRFRDIDGPLLSVGYVPRFITKLAEQWTVDQAARAFSRLSEALVSEYKTKFTALGPSRVLVFVAALERLEVRA